MWFRLQIGRQESPSKPVGQSSPGQPRTSSCAATLAITFIAAGVLIGESACADGRSGSLRTFKARRVHDAQESIFGLATGDFDPTLPGQEVAALTRDSDIIELFFDGFQWRERIISTGEIRIIDMSDRPTIDIGDVDPRHPGEEIVLSSSGLVETLEESRIEVAQVFFEPAGGWSRETIVEVDLIGSPWGARVGHFFPGLPNDQIFYIFENVFDFSVGFALRNVTGVWEGFGDDDFVYQAEVGMDSAIGELEPAHPGNEIVVTTEMGETYEILPAPVPGQWPKRLLWDDYENAGWVVEIADIDPFRPGNEIAYGSRYSNSIMLSHRVGNAHALEILFTGLSGEGNMWDIAVADIFPESPGLEIAGVDDTGSVYVVHRRTGQWRGEIIFRNSEGPLYAVDAADYLGTGSAQLLVAGLSGEIIFLVPNRRRHENVERRSAEDEDRRGQP